MKKYCCLLALAALFALAVIPSCKKEPPLRVETNTQSPDPALLQQAQEWYRQQLVLPSSAAEGAIDLKAYTPDWNKAKVVKNSKGQDVVGVPLLSSKEVYIELNVLVADGKPFGIVKKYVLGTDKKIQLSLYRAPGDLISKGYYDKERGLFMAGKSPQGKLMGKRDEEDPTINGGTLEEVVIHPPRVQEPFGTIDNGGGGGSFPSYPIGGFPSDNPIGGSGFDPEGGGRRGGGSSTTPKPAVADITNNVKDPCLKAVVNNLKNADIAGKISEIISELDKNTKVKISVVDAPETSTGKPANTDARGFDPNTKVFSATITLSTNALLISTKENTASAIIHEVIHAYFAYTGQSNKLPAVEHQKMATDYIEPMANFLSGLYNIPIKDATGLAWTGLSNANSYINSTSFSYSGGTMTKKEIEDIYRDYITKNAGTPVCN